MEPLDLNVFLGIGDKIQKVAKIYFLVGMILSVILLLIGLFNVGRDPLFFLIFLLIAATLAITSYISSLLIYGFGDLIENTKYIHTKISSQKNENE